MSELLAMIKCDDVATKSKEKEGEREDAPKSGAISRSRAKSLRAYAVQRMLTNQWIGA